MNRSRAMKPRRFLAMITMLFAAMVTTLLLPAYGQEVDPTWYNPWAATSTAVAHPSPKRAAVHQRQAKLRPVSTSASGGKLRGKRSTTSYALMTRLAK
jgi:hypothetical protein